MSCLVLPSLAVTACLWMAAAARATGGPGLAVQVVVLTGLLAALGSANGARAYAYSCRLGVPGSRGRAEACFAICASGTGIAAVAGALLAAGDLLLLALLATASVALVLTACYAATGPRQGSWSATPPRESPHR